MKKIKKVMALVIAMAMVLSMSLAAFAADNTVTTVPADTAKGQGNFTIEMTNAEAGHTFKAYRIFDGSVSTDGKLGDISWAQGVTTTGIIAKLKTAGLTTLADNATAADVAEALKGQADDSEVMQKVADVFYDAKGSAAAETSTFAENKYTLSGLVAGYYLVTDEYAGTPDEGAATLSRNILAVAGNVTAEVKNDKPEVNKKILTDGTEANADTKNTANVGETVVYQITGKVPNYAGYDKYFYVINDTLSTGLTFDGANTIKVNVGGTDISSDDYVVYTGTNASPHTFEVAFKNIKSYTVGADIKVTYTATVNANAEMGSTGNPNTTSVTYSNNPNDSSHGNPSDNPKPDQDVPTGTSVDKKTVTYVAKLDLTKTIDSLTGDKLANAGFTLTGTSTVVVGTGGEAFEEDPNGTYYKLTDGTYTTTAPHGEIKDSAGVVKVESNEDSYEDTTKKYKLTKSTTYSTETKAITLQAVTDSDGKLTFEGLGAGTYTLTETTTPSGYTTAAPITFTISATLPETITTGDEKCTWASDNENVIVNGTTGVYETTVVDKSGSTLPSTGGIGTTIFYIIGSILVIGAGVVMITRRRMSA